MRATPSNLLRLAAIGILTMIVQLPTEALGQSSLSGRVMDATTQEPLVGANVVVAGTTTGSTTDLDGRFRFSWTGAMPITLRVTYVGYAENLVEVADAAGSLNIALEPRVLSQGAIVVSASRRSEKVTSAPASISLVYGRELQAQTLSSPVEALRSVAGVDVSEQGINSYTVTLRGRNLAFDTATHVLIDNREATTPGLSVTIFGRQPLNPDDLDRIEVIRGPGSALYGPGVDAGVVHFITKNPFDHPGTDVRVSGGTQSSFRFNGTHRGVAGRLGYKLNAIYGRADNWNYDPSNTDDAAFLAALGTYPQEIISAVDGRVYDTIDGFDPETFTYGGTASLEYRFDDRTKLMADAGYTRYKGINRFTLGEIFNDFPELYGQIRLSSGNLFVQGYYLNAANDERTFLYRTGRTLVFNNRQYELQTQYAYDLPRLSTNLIFGGEFTRVTTDTRGTIDGKFEADDASTVFGGYAQSQTDLSSRLSLTLAGRVDRFRTIEQTVFSPRAGLVFKATPTQTFRVTFNRAFSAPTNLSLFTDLPVADLADLDPLLTGDVRLLGGAVPITFREPPRTVSFLPGIGSYDGIGIPLQLAYNVALQRIAGLPTPIPAEILAFLQSKAPRIAGFSVGLPFDVLTEEPGDPKERTYLLKPQKTDMAEVGWTGVFDRVYVSASAYWTRKQDFESDIRVFSPVVVPFALATELPNAIDGVVTNEELAELGMTREQLRGLFTAVATPLSETPVGLLQPDQVPVSARPQLVGSFVNYGSIDYAGLELSATVFVSSRLSVNLAYTHLSKIDFSDEDLGVPGTGERYALNMPANSFSAKADWLSGAVGPTFSLAYRFKEAFEGDFGDLFAGTIGRMSIVDAAAGYEFPGGISVNLTVQNAFDSRYRSFVGLPQIGRLILASARYSF